MTLVNALAAILASFPVPTLVPPVDAPHVPVSSIGPAPAPVRLQEWRPVSTAGAPTPRAGHTAVWTGTRMLVWGGYDGSFANTGGAYDPVGDSWTPLSTVGAPSPRSGHTAVWTGSRMIVWGGIGGGLKDDGAEYDPASDAWQPLPANSAPGPRERHLAIWTGTRMIVWGGYDDGATFFGDGASYDPAARTWTPLATAGAPGARAFAAAAWTGTQMFVWGGASAAGFDSFVRAQGGGAYDPERDTWSPVSLSGDPAVDPVAVFTGSTVVVFVSRLRGAEYDPARDDWTAIPITSTYDGSSCAGTSGSSGASAVWTGKWALVWGGDCTNAGFAWDPSSRIGFETTRIGAPASRDGHTAVWTGREMIVWGGWTPAGNPDRLGDGARLRLGR